MALLAAAQDLVPGSRLDLLATSGSRSYYEHLGFRPFFGFRISSEDLLRSKSSSE